MSAVESRLAKGQLLSQIHAPDASIEDEEHLHNLNELKNFFDDNFLLTKKATNILNSKAFFYFERDVGGIFVKDSMYEITNSNDTSDWPNQRGIFMTYNKEKVFTVL